MIKYDQIVGTSLSGITNGTAPIGSGGFSYALLLATINGTIFTSSGFRMAEPGPVSFGAGLSPVAPTDTGTINYDSTTCSGTIITSGPVEWYFVVSNNGSQMEAISYSPDNPFTGNGVNYTGGAVSKVIFTKQ